MRQTRQLTAIIEREGDGYVSLCPELDIASQGMSVEEARLSLIEALELFFETADPSEIESRLHSEVFVTRVEIGIGGQLRVLSGREVCAILAEHGFAEVRRRGSHIVMQKRSGGTTTTVPVPDHAELRTGTLLSIIRQSGLPRELFESS